MHHCSGEPVYMIYVQIPSYVPTGNHDKDTHTFTNAERHIFQN
jgi:hypothetical protein